MVGRHDFHHIEYAITFSFSFLSSGRLGFAGGGFLVLNECSIFATCLMLEGGGLEVCMFPG